MKGMLYMNLLNLKNVSKIYKTGKIDVCALNDINLSINKGELVAIIGESGSGKSTMLNLLGGLDTPTSGEINVDGMIINKLGDNELSNYRRDSIGFVFQYYNLLPYFTVEENIVLPLRMAKKKVDKDYLEKIINTLGLNDRITHLPSELSGGQQQRVAIARALINKPNIILADEPTGNLDSKNTKEVLELLKHTSSKFNQTIIIVTHDLSITNYVNRVITMEDGNIISDEVSNIEEFSIG